MICWFLRPPTTSTLSHCALGSGLPAWRRLSYRSRRLRDDNRRTEGGNYSTPLFPSEHNNHTQTWTSTWCLKSREWDYTHHHQTTLNTTFQKWKLWNFSTLPAQFHAVSNIFVLSKNCDIQFYAFHMLYNFMLFIYRVLSLLRSWNGF